jgi:hypothetical protein
MMDPRHDNTGFVMPNMSAPSLMNPPPQLFGGYRGTDGLSSINLADLSQPVYGDATLMDESIEAKRRRIARVGHIRDIEGEAHWADGYRLVICVGRRRSSVTGSCRLARIVSTTRQNVFSHKWKRRGILRRG